MIPSTAAPSLMAALNVDSVFMTGDNLDYSVSDNGGGNYTVTDNRPGSPDGTKTLSNVEFIEFTDGQVGL